jgi:hypothetical protein
MRGENYIFLKNKYLLLSLFIILITLITKTSCTPNTLWDIPIETIKQKIYNSDYSFIEDINFNNKNLSNVKVLGPGALYYFSIIFSRTGYPGIAE